MPSQLFFDHMTTIKNVYVCIGKTQVHNPLGSFWLSLPFTDSFKGLFGQVQTIQDNDSNMDQLQLANHIDSAVICTNIPEEHPEWGLRPRQLNLKSWTQQAGDVSTKIDHINHYSWQGDVSVKNVVLMTCWSEGHQGAR